MTEESGEGAHPLAALRVHTAARIALGRAGAALPTAAALDLALAHANARDAVHAPFDVDALAAALQAGGVETVRAASRAGTRGDYLKRPDLGRALDPDSRVSLESLRQAAPFDLAVLVADGLSAAAANENAARAALALLAAVPRDWRVAPIVLATQGRVALGDPVGEALGARLVVVLIGERPGLSAADSLGAYLTFRPRIGLTDANRNCVSNIRAGGLAPEAAGRKIAFLARRALILGLTGTCLKDDEADRLDAGAAPSRLDAPPTI